MNNSRLFLSLMFLLMICSCRTDLLEENPMVVTDPIEFPVSVEGNLVGLVVDENDQPIVDVEINFDGQITNSDENGYFKIEKAFALNSRSLVNIQKVGYYEGYKFVSFEAGQTSILKVKLVKKEIIDSYPSTDSRTTDVNGAQLFLPPNITTLSDGTPYVGQVNVTAYWYDPTDQEIIQTMPGDLRGQDAEGNAVQLTTYGMMVVELTGDNNQNLDLASGMKATLTFPLPSSNAAADEIPMWHLNEISGVWLEEGTATKQGSSMVAEVSHFSFWNCDDPYPLVYINGRIITENNADPISGLQVVITDNNSMVSGYGYTDQNGVFSGLVPQGNDLSLGIYSCGNLVELQKLGTLTEDTDLKDIVITAISQRITATIVDCEGELIAEGYAMITTPNTFDLTYANQGLIEQIIFPCSLDEGSLTGFNSETFDISDHDSYISIIATVPGSDPLIYMDFFSKIIQPTSPMDQEQRVTVSSYVANGDVVPWTNIGYLVDLNISGTEPGDLVSGSYSDTFLEWQFVLEIDELVTSSSVTGNIWIDDNQNGLQDSNENETISAYSLNG